MRIRWNRLRGLESIFSHGWRKKKKKKDDGKMMVSKTQARPKTGMKACLDLWYMVLFFFFPLSFSSFHPHTYTWESRQLMCCLWWQRQAYINSQKTMMKGLRKRRKNGYKMWYQKGTATHGKYMGWSERNQTSGCWGLKVWRQRRKGGGLTVLAWRQWRLRLA